MFQISFRLARSTKEESVAWDSVGDYIGGILLEEFEV
jgi:hypothetical protein